MSLPKLHAVVTSACIVLAGCASTSGLAPTATSRDANDVPAQRTLSEARIDPAAWPATDWWKAFGDPQLAALMDEALAGNPTLNIAAARTRKALALAAESKSALFPRVDASASATRERFPEHGLIPPPFGGTTQTLSDLQLSLSWEIDFWGKNRNAYEAALGQARATEVDAYAARLALSTDIARAYAELLRAYLELDVAKQTLASL